MLIQSTEVTETQLNPLVQIDASVFVKVNE